MAEGSLITIGRVTGVHGLTGKLKVLSFADSLDAFESGNRVRLDTKKESGNWYTISKSAPYKKKGVLLTLKGVENRDKAETLMGHTICIHTRDLPALDDDTFYWQDLMGLDVMDKTRGYIGKIEHIFPTGANDVLVVKNSGTEILVPVIASVIRRVNLPDNQMDIDLPEGL